MPLCGPSREDKRLVEIKDLVMRYSEDAAPAVSGISCKIRNGKIYGLLGPKGAGKSTLINIMAGVVCPTEGTVLINGYDIRKQPREAKKQIGYLPEALPVLSHTTVYEYLAFIASAKGVKGELLQAQIKEALTLTDLLSVRDRLTRNLSEGQLQSLGLAQALLGTPDVLLLDAPFRGPEPRRATLFKDLLRKLGQTRTVVISAASLSELGDLCDRVIVLSEGRLIAEDTPDALGYVERSTGDASPEEAQEEILAADYEEQEAD